MNTLIEWLFVDPYLAIAIVIMISTLALILYVYVQVRDFVKRWGNKSAVIKHPLHGVEPSSKEPVKKEITVSAHKEKINRLMRVHGIAERKAEELQLAIYNEWNETTSSAQKSVDKRHGLMLDELK